MEASRGRSIVFDKKNRPGGEPGTAVKITDGELGKETSQR